MQPANLIFANVSKCVAQCCHTGHTNNKKYPPIGIFLNKRISNLWYSLNSNQNLEYYAPHIFANHTNRN